MSKSIDRQPPIPAHPLPAEACGENHQGRFIMCDVNVFIVNNGVEEKVLENVDLIEEVAGGMHLVNIFGEERTLKAKMVHYNNSEKRMVFQPV